MTAVDLGWRYTPHALLRMEQMEVDADEVMDTLHFPELSYPGSRRYPAGRTVHVRGRIGVIVSEQRDIITVIWHQKEGR